MPSFQVGFVGSNPTWGSSPRGEVDITRPCEGRITGSSPVEDTIPYSSAVGHCGCGHRSGVRVLLRILFRIAQWQSAGGRRYQRSGVRIPLRMLALVTQWTECVTSNHVVAGSNPAEGSRVRKRGVLLCRKVQRSGVRLLPRSLRRIGRVV